jgi:hypothetical protein
MSLYITGADPGFQVKGAHLKKIAPNGGRREKFWGISCEKSRFYAKKIIFFPILGGARAGYAPPPGSAPALCMIPELNTPVNASVGPNGIFSNEWQMILELEEFEDVSFSEL